MSKKTKRQKVGQQRLEETLRWYAPALGLAHWDLKAAYDPADLEVPARVWRSDDYHHAIVQIRDNNQIPDGWGWKDWSAEQGAVHELVHLAMRDLDNVVEQILLPQLPKNVRKRITALWDHHREGVTEVMANALVAVAYADRADVSPQVGRVMPSEPEKEAI